MTLKDQAVDRLEDATDRDGLSALAAELADVTSAFGELATLERRVEDKLREQVARILNRYEQCPDEIRDIEARIMEINDPLLPVALLQQYYLVRSEGTERSIVAQLARLAQTSDRKAGQLALDALREAAQSDISRLRNLGSRAVFASEKLGEADLLAYARDAKAPLPLRIQAATALTKGRYPKGAEGFIAILTSWCELSNDRRPTYSDQLQEVARSFRNYKVEEHKADAVAGRLFAAFDNGELARFDKETTNAAKRHIQVALASIEEATLSHARSIAADSVTYDHIFTLRRIAHRSPEATRILVAWMKETLNAGHYSPRSPRGAAKQIAISLRQAQWGGLDAQGTVTELERLLRASTLDNEDEIIEQLSPIGTSQPSGPPKLREMLAGFAEDYESWGQLEKGQALSIRHAFETGNKHITLQQLTPEMRRVLMAALSETAETNPWRSSARWFMQNYQHCQGQDRITILEALGEVAKIERRDDVETDAFRSLRTFFTAVTEKGGPSEAVVARQLLGRVSIAARPQGIKKAARP